MDQFYVEDGYVDSAYFEVIVDSGTIGLQPYFAEDYAETGYAEQRGSEFTLYANTDVIIVTGSGIIASAGSLTATVGVAGTLEADIALAASTSAAASRSRESAVAVAATVNTTATAYRIIEAGADFSGVMSATMTATAFKNHTAALDSHATMTVDADITTDAGGLLEYFADLNAQAARFRSTNSNIASQFHMGHGGIGTNIDANASFEGASIFTTTTSLSVTPTSLTISDPIAINSEFAQSTHAISYVPKSNVYGRPNPFVGWYFGGTSEGVKVWKQSTGVYEFTTANKFDGSYSVAFNTDFLSNVNYYGALAADIPATNIGANTDFFMSVWIDQNDSDIDTYTYTTFMSAGTGFNTLIDQYNTPDGVNPDGIINIGLKRASDTVSYLYAKIKRVDGTYIELVDTVNFSDTVGTPVAVRRSGDTITLYRGTVPVATAIYSGALSPNITRVAIYPPEKTSTQNDAFFDRAIFKIGDAGPTNIYDPIYNDENTVVYASFEQTLDDSAGYTLTAAANMASTVTQTVDTNGVFGVAGTFNSDFAQSSTVGVIKPAAAALQSNGAQLAVVAKIADFFVNADMIFNFAVQEDLFKAYDSNIAAVTSTEAVAAKTTDVTVNITGAFTPVIETDGFKRITANLASNSSMLVTATRYQPGAAVLSVSATQSTDAIKAVSAEAAFSATASQPDTDYIRRRNTAADLTVTGAQLSAVAKIADFFVNADITATMSVDGVVRAGVVVEDLVNPVTMSTAADRIRNTAGNFNTASTVTVDGVLVTDSTANFVSTSAAAAAAARTRGVVSDFDSIATQLSVIGKIAPYTAGLEVTSSVSADINVITDTGANTHANASTSVTVTRIHPGAAVTTSNTTLNATLNKTTSFEAAINTAATVTAVGAIKVFNLDQYRYTIPRETRGYTVDRETRVYSVYQESRTYTIEGT